MKILKAIVIYCLIHSNTAFSEDIMAIYEQALGADPTTKASEVKVKIGEDQKDQALGEMLPQVSGTLNWSTNNQRFGNQPSNDYRGTRYTISLNQTVIDLAKFWNWQRTKEVENQYALENTYSEQNLMFEVVDKYFSVLEAEDEHALYKKEAEITEQQVEQIQKLFDKQQVKITDLYAIQSRLDQIKAQTIEAEAKLVTAKQTLQELTNSPPVSLSKLREEVDYKELEGKLEDWLEVAKSENPSLAAQASAIKAADHDVATQKSRHLPVVEIQLNYFNTDTGFQQQALNNLTETRVAALNVTVPIFSGGIIHNKTSEAQHKLTLAKYDNDAKLRAVAKETSDAFLNANASVRRIKANKIALESAAKSSEAMGVGFDYGVETMNDVLDAQQTEFVAMHELAKAKYSYVKNRMRFLQAIGTISPANLQEINKWLAPPTAAIKQEPPKPTAKQPLKML